MTKRRFKFGLAILGLLGAFLMALLALVFAPSLASADKGNDIGIQQDGDSQSSQHDPGIFGHGNDDGPGYGSGHSGSNTGNTDPCTNIPCQIADNDLPRNGLSNSYGPFGQNEGGPNGGSGNGSGNGSGGNSQGGPGTFPGPFIGNFAPGIGGIGGGGPSGDGSNTCSTGKDNKSNSGNNKNNGGNKNCDKNSADNNGQGSGGNNGSGGTGAQQFADNQAGGSNGDNSGGSSDGNSGGSSDGSSGPGGNPPSTDLLINGSSNGDGSGNGSGDTPPNTSLTDDPPTQVPEPLTLSLFTVGLAGAVMMRRRSGKTGQPAE